MGYKICQVCGDKYFEKYEGRGRDICGWCRRWYAKYDAPEVSAEDPRQGLKHASRIYQDELRRAVESIKRQHEARQRQATLERIFGTNAPKARKARTGHKPRRRAR